MSSKSVQDEDDQRAMFERILFERENEKPHALHTITLRRVEMDVRDQIKRLFELEFAEPPRGRGSVVTQKAVRAILNLIQAEREEMERTTSLPLTGELGLNFEMSRLMRIAERVKNLGRPLAQAENSDVEWFPQRGMRVEGYRTREQQLKERRKKLLARSEKRRVEEEKARAAMVAETRKKRDEMER